MANSFVWKKCYLHLRSSVFIKVGYFQELVLVFMHRYLRFLCQLYSYTIGNHMTMSFGIRQFCRFPVWTEILPLFSGPGNGSISPLNEIHCSIMLKPAQDFEWYDILCLNHFPCKPVKEHVKPPVIQWRTKGFGMFWSMTKDDYPRKKSPKAVVIKISSL